MAIHLLSKKIISIAIAAVSLITAGLLMPVKQADTINVAVLYSGGSKTYMDIYQHFSQPLLTNLKAVSIDVGKPAALDLKSYDIVYPDISIMKSPAGDKVRTEITDFVAAGGSVFLENGFYNWFPNNFLGAKSFKKVQNLPDKMDFPKVRYDLQPIQKLVQDFYDNFKKFRLPDKIKGRDFGYGMIAGTAVPIVNTSDTSLYTLNSYKKGYVFFASSLLPNPWFINGFDMTAKTADQVYFNNTVAAANQMIGNEYAAFVSKQKFGYALKKVFGPYGRPAAAWQNHFEVLPAVKEGSMQIWTDITKKYDEIPSFSLSRGVFEWFKRYESIGYHINQDTGNGLVFKTDREEAFYTAGKHAVVDGSWLDQAKCPKEQGFFTEINLPHRAYPYVDDLNADGINDIVSGSSDGYFYYYEGLKSGDDWILKKAVKLKQANGADIKVNGYSTPVMYDLNGDGFKDLVSGSESGEVVWWQNDRKFHFKPMGKLINTASSFNLSAPDINDMNGDRKPDLVVGSKDGKIYFFAGRMNGKTLGFGTGSPLKSSNGSVLNAGANAAPRLIDLNGDGNNDLAVGTYSGYIRKFINKKLVLSDAGYFDDNTPNYMGNKHIKNGNNAVPAFADLNGDGKPDLIVGRLEYGMAVPIDSPWFPYKNELQTALDYVKKNFIGIEPHEFTNIYKSSEEEIHELEMQRKSFEQYGLTWDNSGTNQHTWKLNITDPAQTFMNEYDSGLSWNSGFEDINSGLDPSGGTENTWIIPFYLNNKGSPTGMMIFNTTPAAQGYYGYIGAWDMPVSLYLHTEYDSFSNPQKLEKLAAFLDQFRDKYDYDFMTEPQMARTFAAVLNTRTEVNAKPLEWLSDTLQNKVRTLQQFSITINPVVEKDARGLLDGPYKDVAGVKVEAGEKYLSAPLDTDADIYMRKGPDLYVGLNKPVKVFVAEKPEKRAHIERVNLPVEVTRGNGSMSIKFLDGGLQQVKLYVPGGVLKVSSQGWKSEKSGDNMYVLTRYGAPTELKVNFTK